MSKIIENPAYRIQVLDRVFQILDVLAGDGPELGVTELAAVLELRRSTAHRLVMVLESKGLLERDPISGKCRLGPRVLQLGLVALARLDLVQAARPHLHRLVKEADETAHLGLLYDTEVVSIVNVQSSQTIRSPGTVGGRTPFHCASQGKAILAFARPEHVKALLDRGTLKSYTPNTITSEVRFMEELEVIRQRGYAIDDEEVEVGLRCLAAPVRDSLGEVIAAVSIAGPVFRMSNERIAALSSAVMCSAGHLSESLGYCANKDSTRSAVDSNSRSVLPQSCAVRNLEP
jgi:IclR family KDG regulon transcriptional repressor